MAASSALRRTAAACAILGLVAGPQSGGVAAQVLRGVVLDAADRTPLSAVLVTLTDERGRDRQRFLVDADGRFEFVLPAPGRYGVRAERMGTATRALDDLVIGSTDTLVVRLPLEAQALALTGIDVTAERRCALRDDAGAMTQRVWEEARKALNVVSHTDSVGAYRYQLRRHQRELEPGTLLVRREVSSSRSVVTRRPIRSRPVELLMDSGFVVRSRGGDRYFAPDADVLLSESFLATHCFALRAGVGRLEGMVGLEFRPQIRRRVGTDIAGVLWLDGATGALDHLAYEYVDLPEPARRVEIDGVGGHVQFKAMPDGSWIVSDWYIRMPRVDVTRDPVFGVDRPQLAGLVEEGGRIERAWRLGGGPPAFADRPGNVVGWVVPSTPAHSEGATVRIPALGAESPVDREGHFRLDEVPPGRYELSYVRPALMGLDTDFPVATITVAAGDSVTVQVRPPPQERVLERACGVDDWVDGTAVLRGEVIEPGTGLAVPNASVEVSWQVLTRVDFRAGRIGTETMKGARSDATGSFRVCGVPVERNLRVAARLDASSSLDTEVVIPRGQAVAHVVVRFRPR